MSNVKPCSLWMTHYSGNPPINNMSLLGVGFRKAGVTKKCAKEIYFAMVDNYLL